MAKPNELREGYYLENFERLLDHVQSTYDDLLSKSASYLLSRFAALSGNGKRLFVRLSMRSKSFYRQSKLNYSEINISDAVKELFENKLLEINPYIEIPDILDPFTVAELKSFSREYFQKKPPVGNREVIVSFFEKMITDEDDFYQFLFSKDQLLWPMFQKEWEMLKLMFFGSRFQDMEQFILEDLGILRFEQIEIDRSTRLFKNWQQVKVSYEWSELHAQLWAACFEKELEIAEANFKEIKKLKFVGSPLKRRYSKSANLMAKLYENFGDYEKALRIYKTSQLEPARERIARLYDKLGYPKKAKKICQSILKEPTTESERYFAEFFIEKMKKALGEDYRKQKRLKVPPETPLPVAWDKFGSVEEQVLNYLKDDKSMRGFFNENRYFPTIAALLFWDEFWSPGVGVFYHPFEQAPRDFLNGEFYFRMEKEIQNRCDYWRQLSQRDFIKKVSDKFQEKQGVACRLTNWKMVHQRELKQILKTVPREDLFNITLQILKDPRQYQSGFPDLFLVDKKGNYLLGEVKSPNDSIQASQKRWIDKFLLWRIPFAIFRTN